MAYRDKSQGFAFVYVDIHKLLASQKAMQVEAMPPNAHTVNMNRDPRPIPVIEDESYAQAQQELEKNKSSSHTDTLPLEQFTPIQPELQNKAGSDERREAIEQVKKNLDRLQNLHHKLHTVLDDLNQVGKWKKKTNKKS